MTTPRNLWIGVGISQRYLRIAKHLKEHLKSIPFNNIWLILADEMARKYNGKVNEELVRRLEEELKKFEHEKNEERFGTVELIPISNVYRHFDFQEAFSQIQRTYEQNPAFKAEVNALVRKNRGQNVNVDHASGYVLEELAIIKAFEKRSNFKKIGPKNSELPFDRLAIKYLAIPESKFLYLQELQTASFKNPLNP